MSLILTTEEAGYRCSDHTDEGPACFRWETGGSLSPAFGLDSFIGQLASAERYQITRTEGRTAAGVEAQCFDFDGDAAWDTEICLAEDGLLLYGSFGIPDQEYSHTAEAVEVKRSVPQDIFERPYDLHPCHEGIREVDGESVC